ncbi:MAG: serine/threonine protein kinase [Clostridium sp.]
MRYILDIKKCKFLGKGNEGSVYLTPEGYALKIFYNEKHADYEVDNLEKVKSSRFFPKVVFQAQNMILREYVEGINLSNYLKKKGLSYKLSIEIIELIEDFKKLGFTRLNIRDAHIFVDKNAKIKVIDPRKPFVKITPYPKDIIKTLVKQDLFDDFLKHVMEYNPELLSYWVDGYTYLINLPKKQTRMYIYAL